MSRKFVTAMNVDKNQKTKIPQQEGVTLPDGGVPEAGLIGPPGTALAGAAAPGTALAGTALAGEGAPEAGPAGAGLRMDGVEKENAAYMEVELGQGQVGRDALLGEEGGGGGGG